MLRAVRLYSCTQKFSDMFSPSQFCDSMYDPGEMQLRTLSVIRCEGSPRKTYSL